MALGTVALSISYRFNFIWWIRVCTTASLFWRQALLNGPFQSKCHQTVRRPVMKLALDPGLLFFYFIAISIFNRKQKSYVRYSLYVKMQTEALLSFNIVRTFPITMSGM